jgi:hypothetical protein
MTIGSKLFSTEEEPTVRLANPLARPAPASEPMFRASRLAPQPAVRMAATIPCPAGGAS